MASCAGNVAALVRLVPVAVAVASCPWPRSCPWPWPDVAALDGEPHEATGRGASLHPVRRGRTRTEPHERGAWSMKSTKAQSLCPAPL